MNNMQFFALWGIMMLLHAFSQFQIWQLRRELREHDRKVVAGTGVEPASPAL